MADLVQVRGVRIPLVFYLGQKTNSSRNLPLPIQFTVRLSKKSFVMVVYSGSSSYL